MAEIHLEPMKEEKEKKMNESKFEVKCGFDKYKKYIKSFGLCNEKYIDNIKEDWDTTEHYIKFYCNEKGELQVDFHFKGIIEDEETLEVLRDSIDEKKNARRFWDRMMREQDESFNATTQSLHGSTIKNKHS